MTCSPVALQESIEDGSSHEVSPIDDGPNHLHLLVEVRLCCLIFVVPMIDCEPEIHREEHPRQCEGVSLT